MARSKKPPKGSCAACMSALRLVQAKRDEANANVENLTRLLSNSDKKRHELFEEVTEAKREAEGWRADAIRARMEAKEASAEVARLSADNRMYFSLLVSERAQGDRKHYLRLTTEQP